MRELSQQEKAFFDLWNSGHRFLTEKEMDNLNYNIHSNHDGKFEGYTIEGLKNKARNGKLTLNDVKLTEEEVEIMFSYIKFMRQFKVRD